MYCTFTLIILVISVYITDLLDNCQFFKKTGQFLTEIIFFLCNGKYLSLQADVSWNEANNSREILKDASSI